MISLGPPRLSPIPLIPAGLLSTAACGSASAGTSSPLRRIVPAIMLIVPPWALPALLILVIVMWALIHCALGRWRQLQSPCTSEDDPAEELSTIHMWTRREAESQEVHRFQVVSFCSRLPCGEEGFLHRHRVLEASFTIIRSCLTLSLMLKVIVLAPHRRRHIVLELWFPLLRVGVISPISGKPPCTLLLTWSVLLHLLLKSRRELLLLSFHRNSKAGELSIAAR